MPYEDTSGQSAIGGLLSGFANSYMQQKKLQNDQAMQQAYLGLAQKNQAMGMLKDNMVDNGSGGVQYNQEGQNQQELQGKQTQASLNEYDPSSDVSKAGYGAISGYAKTANVPIDQIWPKTMSAGEFNNSIAGKYLTKTGDFNLEKIKENIMAQRYGNTLDQQNNTRFSKFSDSIDPNKGRAGNAGDLKNRLQKADRIDQLVQKSKDTKGGLTEPEMQELATATAALLKGSGNVSEGEIKGLVPNTGVSTIQGFAQYLTNNPKTLNNQKFVDNYQNLVDRERAVTTQSLKSALYGKVSGYSDLKAKDPERFEATLRGQGLNSDEYDQFQKNGGKLSPQSGGLINSSNVSGSGSPQSNNVHPALQNMTLEQLQALKAKLSTVSK
jgi:hypothetical protein